MKQKASLVQADANMEQLIKNFVNSYESEWRIGVVEPLQNSGDAQGHNIEEGNIPEDREVEAEFKVNTEENTIEYRDKGAGGMPEKVLGDIVTSLGDSTKQEAGSGGGQFGIGLWVTTGLCNDNGKMYIESKYEETGNSHASVLYPTGQCLQIGVEKHGKPDEVLKRTEIQIESERPESWDVGGTMMRIENIDGNYIEKLGDWKEVKKELKRKFSLLSDQFNIKWTIDGEVHKFSPTPWEEFKGDVVRRETDINVEREKEGIKIDEIVFFEVDCDEGVPWGSKIPLVKSRPHFDNPYMIVKKYGTPKASSVTGQDSSLAAYAVIDTICDDYDKERVNHDDIQITKFSDKVSIGDIAREVHMNNLNVVEDSISNKELKNACKEGIGEIVDKAHQVSEEGNIEEEFEIDYTTDSKINVECEGSTVEIEIENKEDILDKSEFNVNIVVEKWGSWETVEEKQKEINVENREIESIEINEIEGGKHRVVATLEDNETGKELYSDSTAVEVDNIGESGIHRNGGSIDSQNETILDEMRVEKVTWHENEEDPDFFIEEEQGEYVMNIYKRAECLIEQLNLSNDSKSKMRQKRLIKKKAALSILTRMMLEADSSKAEQIKKYSKIQEKIEKISIIE